MTVTIELTRPGSAAPDVAAYLLPEGPALVDCGAATHARSLEQALEDSGFALRDIRDVFITHVHLDHGGGAGLIAEKAPRATVWAHPAAVRHLIDPDRLIRSARTVIGEELDGLWGLPVAVPAHQVRPIDHVQCVSNRVSLRAMETPGHARHHVAFAHGDGTVFTGDVAGVLWGDYTQPDTPPSDIDITAMLGSLSTIESQNPTALAVGHIGIARDPHGHLSALRDRLKTWVSWASLGRDAFVCRARADQLRAGVGEDAQRSPFCGSSLERCFEGLAEALQRDQPMLRNY